MGMPLRRIGVAWDASLPSRWALAFAARLAERGEAELTVAHVVPPATDEIAIPLLDRRTRLLAGGDESAARVLAADVVRDRERPPLIAVVGRERFHGLRRRLGTSPVDDLVETVDCPVVVARG